MGKKISYDLHYREQGEDKTLTLNIDFLSKKNYDEYSELMEDVNRITKIWNQYREVTAKVDDLRLKRPDNYKSEIDRLIDEGESLNREGKAFDEKSYNEKRWRLLQRILIDNKIKPTESEYNILKKELAEAIKTNNKNQKDQKEHALKKLEEREKLFTLNFWEESVEISTLMDLLSEVMNKDISELASKKK